MSRMNPMNQRSVIDVSQLPPAGFGNRSPLWWGILGMITIESTLFGSLAFAYFYVHLSFAEWPPHGTANPDLGIPTVMLVLLLVSLVPIYLGDKLAISGKNDKWMMFWIWFGVIFGFVIFAVRCFEFGSLNCRWDDNAYGSVVWFIIGVHTSHILASTIETLVLALHLRHKRIDMKHHVDLHVDTVYWYFVVASWVVFYFIIYWSPRWL
jgi:cytochrome c oxidase subunit 3